MKKGIQTKQLIINTAKTLFAQKGYQGVTMQDICNHTGLSRGGLYRHFDSCQAICSCLITQLCMNQADEISLGIQNNDSAIHLANTLLDRYEQELCDAATSLTLTICEYYREVHDDRMQLLHEQTRDTWRNLLSYGIARKEFHSVDMESFIDRLLFSYQGIRLWSHMIDVSESAKRIIHQTRKELFLDGTDQTNAGMETKGN